MHIQLIPFSVKLEGQPLPAVARQACIHFLGLLFRKKEFFSFFPGVACIAAFDMTGFTVELVIGNSGYFFKPSGTLIPVPHAFPGVMKTFGKKRPQTLSGL
ncbi:MAG: hypothetical protein WAK57_19500 [Desulfobacterales bacterium]